jgi:probable HAF family extracellular repeat protein
MRDRTRWPVQVAAGVVGLGLLVAAPGSVSPAVGQGWAVAGVSTGVPALTAGGVPYTVVQLWASESRAVAVNESGQVAGQAQTHAFLWDPVAGMTDLGTLGGAESKAVAVNELGQVAGEALDASGSTHAFLWDPVAGMTDLGGLGGGYSGARDLNERGQVAGEATTVSGSTHAFLWDPVAGMTDLGTLGGAVSMPGYVESKAVAVNERGQVAGEALVLSGLTHAFLWDPVAGMTDLGTLGGARSVASAMNERGQVVGQARDTQSNWHAFFWDPVAGMSDLGTLGGHWSRAFAVSDRGQVAGRARTSDGEYRGVLWTPWSLAPRLRVEVAKADYGNHLQINVEPAMTGAGVRWTFRVQKRIAGVWKALPGEYYMRGERRLTLGPGRFRVKFANQLGYVGVTSDPVRLTRRTVRVHLGADATRTRLRVNVDPDKGSGWWTFRVQRQRADGTWRTLPRTYCTRGNRETRTLDLKRGTYRVRVQAKYGYRGTRSTPVQLLS